MTTPSHRPSRRGLGPFSGTQLTILLLGLMLTLGLPVGAIAAGSISRTVLSNADGKGTAVVSGGRLQVGAKVSGPVSARISGPVTAKVSGTATVTGRVTDQLAAPSSYFHSMGYALPDSSCNLLLTAPTDHAVVVRLIKFDVADVTSASSNAGAFVYTQSNCAGTAIASVHPGRAGLFDSPFDPGYVVPAGAALYGSGNGLVEAVVYLDGYTTS